MGCSVREQGMAMSTPRHCAVKIQVMCSCEQVLLHQSEFCCEILCLALGGVLPRISSVFSEGCTTKRDSGSMTMGGSGGQLLMEGLDERRARKDGRVLITVGNRNISRSSIPSRETSCTASFSLHSLGISAAVMINVGILSKMVRTADLYAYF